VIKEPNTAEQEAGALRRSVRDLAALATLPAIWISSDLKGGVQNLAEVLCAAVRASFVFIRVRSAAGENVEAAAQCSLRTPPGFVAEVRGHLARHLNLDGSDFSSSIPSPDGDGQLRVTYSHVAMEGQLRGVVIACASAEMGVHDHERLLLHTGAAQVSILLQRDASDLNLQIEARKLREQARLLEGLNQVGTALVAELDLEKIVQRVTDVGRELTGAAFGAFFYNLKNEAGESYTLYTLSGAPREAFSKFPMPRNTAIFNPTFKGEGVVRMADVRKDPRFGKNAPHHGMPAGHLPVVSYLAVPVKSRTGEVLGGLFYGHPEANVFTSNAETALVALASQAAIAIDNANLYAALQKELVRAKQADEATHRLALIVQSSDDAIIAKDLQGIITSWNPGAERMFGYTADEIVGRSIYTLIPPDRRHEEADILGKLRRGERIDHYETVRRAKDGKLVDVSLTISPLKLANGEIVGASKIARDVTEKRRIESQQRALHELADAVNRAVALPEIYDAALRAIRRFHGANRAAVLLYDDDGTMRFGAWDRLSESYRKAVEAYSPWKREDTDPRPVCIEDVAHAEIDQDIRGAMLREGIKALAFIPLTYEKRLLGRLTIYFDGKHEFTLAELRPIETVASQLAFAIKRTESADELESLVAERTASLRKAIEQMEEFSYSVSHDLRSPVRAMRGYAEAILADYGPRLDEEGRELLGRIQRNGLRMDRLIQDLLTYSRLARREIKIEPVSLDRLVREIIPHYPEMSPDAATIDIVGVLPEVLAHEPSLMQAVSNLFSNAVKFVAPGTRPHIRVSAEFVNHRARLWIRDNGIGIPPEYQHRLFGLFERMHTDQQFEGTGIGLAIVRKAVERMNGSVGVVSDGASGSRFWIDLPVPEKS
jgi:PAS domain S-box-containing protein